MEQIPTIFNTYNFKVIHNRTYQYFLNGTKKILVPF